MQDTPGSPGGVFLSTSGPPWPRGSTRGVCGTRWALRPPMTPLDPLRPAGVGMGLAPPRGTDPGGLPHSVPTPIRTAADLTRGPVRLSPINPRPTPRSGCPCLC